MMTPEEFRLRMAELRKEQADNELASIKARIEFLDRREESIKWRLAMIRVYFWLAAAAFVGTCAGIVWAAIAAKP